MTDAVVDDAGEELNRLHERFDEDMSAVVGGALYGYAHRTNARPPVNIARVMREGVEPPTMALDGWLVAGELHLMYSDAETGKTWFGLSLAVDVMRAGGIVAWFDEELGEKVVAERLTVLGAEPELVEAHFAYFPFPAWQATPDDANNHLELLRALRPTLVVYDTMTDVLSEAGLDENSGIDVTRWVKGFPEQARRLGAAQLVLDHVGHAERGRAVGSRAKRSKAKVEYLLERTKPYDRDSVGEAKVTLRKNTRGATIVRERAFRIGGDGEGGFVFEQLELPQPQGRDTARRAAKAAAHMDARLRVAARLREAEGEVTQNQLASLVGGEKAVAVRAAQELANEEGTGVTSRAGPNRSILYRYSGAAGEASGSAPP